MRKILLFLLLLAGSAVIASAAETNGKNAAPEPFRIGVYMNDMSFAASAMRSGEDPSRFIGRHFRRLAENGVSLVVLTVRKEEYLNDYFLPEIRKNGMGLILRRADTYFSFERRAAGWSESTENKRAKIAGDFILRHRKNPQVKAFSLRDEIPPKHVAALLRYYGKILAHAKGTRIFTLHSSLAAAAEQTAFDGELFGAESFPFRCGGLGGTPAVTPDAALANLRKTLMAFRKIAEKHDPPFVFVSAANPWISAKYDFRDIDRKDPAAVRRMKELSGYAAGKRFGWNRTKYGGREHIWRWHHYRPPENCLRAVIWTGILCGAKVILFKHYTPVQKDFLTSPEEKICSLIHQHPDLNAVHHCAWLSLAGVEGEDDLLLTEFLGTARELAPFADLLGRMNPVTDCPVTAVEAKRHFCRAFGIDGIEGRVIVVHNAVVGTYPPADEIRIDDNGNLAGFAGAGKPAEVRLRQTGTTQKLFRCDTGKELVADAGTYSVEVAPGGGLILFAGDEAQFRRLCGMTALPCAGNQAGKPDRNASWQ